MKKLICWLMILLFGVACQKEEKVQNNEEPKEDMKEVKMAALNVCCDTEDADILLLCDDGSYILCDAENYEGYSVVYMNDSLESEFENGISVFLLENGTPVMATSSKGTFVFKNITGDSFDFAFIDNQNEISYYNDIKFDFQSSPSRSSFMTRSILDPWIESWRTLKNSSWDEHSKKAIVPFLCKIASFFITAFDAVGGSKIGLVYTIFDEFNKSGDFENEWIDKILWGTGIGIVSSNTLGFKNGEAVFTPKMYGLSVLAAILNKYGDEQLKKLGQIDEWVGPHFNTEEWMISISPNVLECYPDDDLYLVDVSSKASWDIDESQIDHNWCEVMKLDVQVAVHVKPNENENDRTCNLIIFAKNSSEIAPVSLTIKQSGIIFELSEEKLSFTQDGGSKGVYITTNDNVKSWEVTSYPSWCKIEKAKYSFFVDVNKNDETRSGIITITALTKGGIPINRYLNVEQIIIPFCPDGNHPHAVDLGLPSGTRWACCNVEANAPEECGGYYAWGETYTKSSYNVNDYKYFKQDAEGTSGWLNIGSDIAGTSYDAATANWGASWRMPTKAQIDELVNSTTSEWIKLNGVEGRKITGPNGYSIFIPAAGYRYRGELSNYGLIGSCWSSTLEESEIISMAYSLTISGGGVAKWDHEPREFGLSVRPVY